MNKEQIKAENQTKSMLIMKFYQCSVMLKVRLLNYNVMGIKKFISFVQTF